MDSHKEAAARRIYETIQRWLEDAGPASSAPLSGRDILTIPVRVSSLAERLPAGGDVTTAPKDLRFKRVNTMGGGRWAESLDKAGIRINYDPNWNVLLKIEELLELAKPEVAKK